MRTIATRRSPKLALSSTNFGRGKFSVAVPGRSALGLPTLLEVAIGALAFRHRGVSGDAISISSSGDVASRSACNSLLRSRACARLAGRRLG